MDLILACCHWGIEKDTYPENYQQVLGRKCIDWGVDLVIGHHPHVLQGIEEYKGRYIIYSLANFASERTGTRQIKHHDLPADIYIRKRTKGGGPECQDHSLHGEFCVHPE